MFNGQQAKWILAQGEKMGRFADMLGAHSALCDRLEHSQEFLMKVRGEARKHFEKDWGNIAVFAAGSLGRCEAGRQSDLDVFLVARKEIGANNSKGSPAVSRLDEYRIFAKLIDLNSNLQLPPFSGDGRYLKVHDLTALIASTGDAHDDSENFFTARLLLLLESQPLWNDGLREMAIEAVLKNYFKDGTGKRDFKPLFLLNDILRYWRTLCLNYERDRVSSDKWWKKNLNLKFSRKLTIFSTVLCIVSAAATSQDEIRLLTEKVPLRRLAFALDHMEDEALEEHFRVFLDDYESFLAAKSYQEFDDPGDVAKREFRDKADRFGEFLSLAFESVKIDPKLKNFLII